MSAAAATNAPQKMTFEGKEYTLKELDIDDFGKMTNWIVERAKLAAAIGVSEEQAEVDRNRINAEAGAGLYEAGSTNFVKSCLTRAGASYLLLLALEKHHPDITLLDTQKMIDSGFFKVFDKDKVAPNPKASSGRKARFRPSVTSSRISGTQKSGRSKKSGK